MPIKVERNFNKREEFSRQDSVSDIAPSPLPRGMDTLNDRESIYAQTLLKSQEKPMISQRNEHEASNVTGIFASDASPKIINENSVSQNMTASEPFEEAIIEASRDENNGTGAEEKKT